MDWKELQQRLNDYQSTDLVQKQGQFMKPSSVYKTEKLKELWDLCHEDRTTSFRSLIQQVGFSGRSDYTHIKKWFLKRGWGELPSRIDLTEKYSEEIYNHHKNGLSATQISRLVPLCHETVLRVLKETYGVVLVSSRNNQPTQSDIDEFNRLTEQGYSLRKIAKMTGRSHITVGRYRRKKTVPKTERITKQDQHREQVIRLYQDGNSQASINRQTGVSRGTISRIIKNSKKQNDKGCKSLNKD